MWRRIAEVLAHAFEPFYVLGQGANHTINARFRGGSEFFGVVSFLVFYLREHAGTDEGGASKCAREGVNFFRLTKFGRRGNTTQQLGGAELMFGGGWGLLGHGVCV